MKIDIHTHTKKVKQGDSENGEVDFNLTDATEDLYFHICKEYITELNAELKSTHAELKDNGLLNKEE